MFYSLHRNYIQQAILYNRFKIFFPVIPNKLIDKKGERLLKKYVMYMKTKK